MNILTDEHKVKSPKTNMYRGTNTWINTQGPELKADTDFKGWCSDLEGSSSIFDLGLRALDIFSRTMKDLEQYLGATYRNICQPAIINNTTETSPDPEIPTIIPDTGPKLTKTNGEMTYLKKKKIDEYIHQKLMKKDVFKTDLHNIYNIIMGKTNYQLQEKAESDTT